MIDMKTPLVTVLINNYNYEKFISQSIDSVLSQDYKNIEIVVVDDGSTDNSRVIISEYRGRVKIIFKENGGQASAFNAGFKESLGDIICFLDADDIFLEGKILSLVKIFNDYPEAGWFFHELQYTDANGAYIEQVEAQEGGELIYKDFSESIRGIKKMPYFPATSGLSFRLDLLRNILPMPEKFRISADYFLRLAALCQKPGVLSPEKLATHRQHDKNLYVRHPDMHSSDAETGVYAAYYFRKIFSGFESFSNRIFARSAGRLVALKGFRYTLKLNETTEYLKIFFRDINIYEWINFILCLKVNFLRTCFKKQR